MFASATRNTARKRTYINLEYWDLRRGIWENEERDGDIMSVSEQLFIEGAA